MLRIVDDGFMCSSGWWRRDVSARGPGSCGAAAAQRCRGVSPACVSFLVSSELRSGAVCSATASFERVGVSSSRNRSLCWIPCWDVLSARPPPSAPRDSVLFSFTVLEKRALHPLAAVSPSCARSSLNCIIGYRPTTGIYTEQPKENTVSKQRSIPYWS